jgi:hypothetical protein
MQLMVKDPCSQNQPRLGLPERSIDNGASQFVWGDATSPDRRSVHATHLHPRTLFLYALYGWPLRGYAFPKARAVVNGLELSALSHEFTSLALASDFVAVSDESNLTSGIPQPIMSR